MEALNNQEVPLSEKSPEELDKRLEALEQEVLNRKQEILDLFSGALKRGNSRDVQFIVDPATLEGWLRSLLEAVGVNLQAAEDMRLRVQAAKGSPALYANLDWFDNTTKNRVEQIGLYIKDDPGDQGIINLSLQDYRRTEVFNSSHLGRTWGDTEGEYLKRSLGEEAGQKVFQALSKPFERLAFAKEVALLPQRSTIKS